MSKLQGANLVGGNPANGRIELDYYATNPEAVKMLLDRHRFRGKDILEPCVGAGHIAKELNNRFREDITAIDIVDRGYPDTIVADFLNWEPDKTYDTIITNPPYSLATEFIEKCIECLTDSNHVSLTGQLAMFLKINFLEGKKREKLFNKYPPKYLYVFRKRMPIFTNGIEFDPKTGKPWKTTFCNAWFVWEKGFHGEPTIRWL